MFLSLVQLYFLLTQMTINFPMPPALQLLHSLLERAEERHRQRREAGETSSESSSDEDEEEEGGAAADKPKKEKKKKGKSQALQLKWYSDSALH